MFRRKLKIGIATLFAYGGFAAPEHAHAARAEIGTQRIELDLGSTALPRTLLLYSADALATPIELPSADAQWRTTDLQLGLARLVEGQREQWTPQQLALDRLQAYSVKKGCYPGQEIVARTHFLGKAKRALQLLETDAAVDAGDAVALDGSAIGTVVSVAGNLALAVLPLELTLDAGTALQAAGMAPGRAHLRRGWSASSENRREPCQAGVDVVQHLSDKATPTDSERPPCPSGGVAV